MNNKDTNWSEWTKKFSWFPIKINNKWYWLKTYYERERLLLWFSKTYEYDYAFNILDIIKKS